MTLLMMLALNPAQAQEASCKSAYGSTACGYDCKAEYGMVVCAQTPQGRCESAYGKVTCWDPPAGAQGQESRERMRTPLVKAQCHAEYGEVVCGYSCKAGYGEVVCASTPAGICESANGTVACWDPPGVQTVLPNGTWPDATCHSGYGTTACGFDCIAEYGVVKCAQTPFGACKSAYGEVVCWDPQLPQRAGHRRSETAPHGPSPLKAPLKAECITGYGKIACGYGCESGYGDLACATTPNGRCEAAYGELTCWDPPIPGMQVPDPGAWPDAECRSSYGTTACGYDCLSEYGVVKCAQTPWGTCEGGYGQVTCWDPPYVTARRAGPSPR